jgi:anaerobic magnesium-protoporphyrin IX monomethyl ester cyclase
MRHGHIVLATPAPVSNRTAEENLGLGYLASVLRRNAYEVEVIDGWLGGMTTHEIVSRICATGAPLWIGFSCYRTNMGRVIEASRLLRERGVEAPIVAGGFGPTFHPDDFLQAGVDIAVRGEGEETVLELSSHYGCGEPPLDDIRGISFLRDGLASHRPSRPLLPDLDSIPLPARDTLPLTIRRKSPGCPAHCLFCSVVAFMRLSAGPQWRQRSVRAIVDEIEQLAQRGARWFKIVDDSLLEPPRDLAWCSAFADEVNRRNLDVRLRGMVRADRVDDEIVGELRRAGFTSFYVGIESFADSALLRMRKTASAAVNASALAAFRRHGVYVNAGYILFDHGTTIDELRLSLHGFREHEWMISKGIFSEMFAAEGTPYTRLLGRRGLLRDDGSGSGNRCYDVLDDRARAVYAGLRQWGKLHARVYDKAVDPIASPKALDDDLLARFHSVYVLARRRDLDIFESLLNAAEDGATVECILGQVAAETEAQAGWYRWFEGCVDRAYAEAGLVYDADENPFLC